MFNSYFGKIALFNAFGMGGSSDKTSRHQPWAVPSFEPVLICGKQSRTKMEVWSLEDECFFPRGDFQVPGVSCLGEYLSQ